MPRKKSMEFKQVCKSFCYTSLGFAGMCTCTMAGFELLPSANIDFKAVHFALPLVFGPALAFGVIAVEGGLSLMEQTQIASRLKSRNRARGLAPITSRAIEVNRGGGNRSTIFAKTFPLNFSLFGKKESGPVFDYKNPATDSGISSRKISKDNPESYEWTVWLTGRISPIKRQQPILIPEGLLRNFLVVVWDRQTTAATKNKAISRNFLTGSEGMCDIPTYYALVGMIDSVILFGRGGGLSGFLTCSPERGVSRVKATYENYSVIEV